MSQAAAGHMAGDHGDAHGHGGGHGGGHNPHLAHHFDTMEQQSETEKLGMWAFLGTEILMFGGLFVAYAVLRYNHPEAFLYGHEFLDKTLGGINTVILIASSFTMAVAVRCAQLGQKNLLVLNLILTLLGGFGFMGIKAVEYKSKWEAALFPGENNLFNVGYDGDKRLSDAEYYLAKHHGGHDIGHDAKDGHSKDAHAAKDAHATDAHTTDTHAAPAAAPALDNASIYARSGYWDPNAGTSDETKIKAPFVQPTGLATGQSAKAHTAPTWDSLPTTAQANINAFFSIYFIMTGLHGLHVVIGMGLIAWILIRAMGNQFSGAYYAPVDLVGLYWHLVDLIWIFLFPLLYLIH